MQSQSKPEVSWLKIQMIHQLKIVKLILNVVSGQEERRKPAQGRRRQGQMIHPSSEVE